MGNPTKPPPVKLVASLICQNDDVLSEAVKGMISHCGPLDFVSETMPFDFTDYYEQEMGGNLWRKLVGFERLIPPETISSIKLLTNDIEAALSRKPNQRRVNIDPGYVTANHVILATTKPAPHRPYLKDGIYADLTLLYQEQGFHALPWTYPDYRSEVLIEILASLRQKFLFQLKHYEKGAP